MCQKCATVVKSEPGRLGNTAPVHKSKFRKCVDFVLACVGLGVLSGMLFGSLLESFGAPWGPLGSSLGHLGVTWDPKSLFSPSGELSWTTFGSLGVQNSVL